MIIKQNKAVKYRAYPTQTQANLIDRTIGCARKIYNLMLEDKEKHYEETGEPLSVTPAAYKKDYPYLKEVDSTALSNAWKNLTQLGEPITVGHSETLGDIATYDTNQIMDMFERLFK